MEQLSKDNEISLIELVREGCISDIKGLLSSANVDINDIDDQGKSAFIYALANGYKGVSRCLLESENFNVNLKGPNEQTYLMLAIDVGYFDIAKQLVELGANTNSKDKDGKSALFIALEVGYFELASFLLKNKAEINVKNNAGWTLLIWASIKGYMKTVQFLLDNGIDINATNHDGWNAITGAFFKNHTNIVDVLTEQGATLGGKYAESALLSAYIDGYYDVVKLLINQGINVNILNDKGDSLLGLAVRDTNKEIVELLIERGADVNAKTSLCATKRVIGIAAQNGENEILQVLIDKGAAVNYQGSSALCDAACYCQQDTCKELISQGANINATSHNGWTPLMHAAGKDDLDLVKFMVTEKANIHLVNGGGQSAKGIAPYNSQTEKYLNSLV